MFALAVLASIVSGHDPDIWFLVAVILLAVAAVICVGDRAWTMALVAAGVMFVALGLLVT